MKSIRIITAMGVFLFVLGALAIHPSLLQAQGQEEHGRHGQMPSVDDHVKLLAEKLNLTDDQQAKVKSILEDTHQQMQTLMKDESISREDKHDKMRSIREAGNAKVRDVLNDDQKKKLDAMEKEMHERHSKENGGGQPK
jgi:Spy/CpxP family protein refolding chaperone